MSGIRTCARGFSLVELLFSIALAATLVGIAVPITSSAVDGIRAAAAARHLAARIAAARMDAVRGAATVALRFEAADGDYLITTHVDRNANGVRTAEILSGIDATIGRAERLRDNHPGIVFGLLPGIPDLDGATGTLDGVRIGTPRILSLTPNGSATPGTLYLHGRRSQHAVRVLGATGRVRVFQYDPGARRWNSR